MKYLYRSFYIQNWSITAKISFALLSAALIPMSFTSYYNMRESLEKVESGEYRKLELLATSTASRLDQLIIDIQRVVVQLSRDRHVVNFLVASPKQQKALYSDLQQTLDNTFKSNPDFDAVFIMDKQGWAVAATDPKFVGKNYAFREYFRYGLQGQSYISGIIVGETTKRPGIFLSYPVRSLTGEIVGVTVIKIRGEGISDIVNRLHIDGNSEAFLIDQEGIIISHPQSSFLYRSLLPVSPTTLRQIVDDRRYGLTQIESLNIFKLQVMVKAKQSGHTTYHYSHKDQIVGFAPLKIQPWVLGISQSKAQFVVPLNRLIWLHSTTVLIVGGITAIIALLLGRSISRPINTLTNAAQALERDKFDGDVLQIRKQLDKIANSQDDIGRLVHIFLQMSEGVRTRAENLKMQVQELRIEIDETKRAIQLTEITENEHFQQIQTKIQQIKSHQVMVQESETDYYQRLQNQVLLIKERLLNFDDLNSVVGADGESRNLPDERR